MKHVHIVDKVLPGSIAEELEIEKGDRLISINGQEIGDVFDYHFLVNDDFLTVLIEKPTGEQWELEIEKDYEDDLGIEFGQGLMDEYRSCRNKCMFCFIDQMPKGMRETLYFKDDDSRLSFLQGNYITLTNMSDDDVDRIIRYHLEPINISFHTTNPELRCKMLHNRFAGEALKKIDRLYEGGITMNGQIVLCKGVNDGEELERSIRDMMKYLPCLQSVSVVPVGLTKYREGLYPLESFTKEDAKEVLSINAGDEWYILAEEEMPEEERYDGYLQLENGVGMMRLLQNEFAEEYAGLEGDDTEREVSIATGVLAYPLICRMASAIEKKYTKTKIHVYGIRNDFFGEKITVSGLITGRDLISQLTDQPLGTCLLLPCNMVRIQEQDFLDDLTRDQVEEALQVKTDIVKSSGRDFIEAVLKHEKE